MSLTRIFFFLLPDDLPLLWELVSEPESSKTRPVPLPDRLLDLDRTLPPCCDDASWAQSGQMSCRTFHPPRAFFFASRTEGWAWQYPSSSNGSAPKRSVLRPPFRELLDLTLLALFFDLALPPDLTERLSAMSS